MCDVACRVLVSRTRPGFQKFFMNLREKVKIKPESNTHVHKSSVSFEKILDYHYYYYYYYYIGFLEILYFTYVSKMEILMCVSQSSLYINAYEFKFCYHVLSLL